MILFLDTEFSNLSVDSQLISLGIADGSGERELYVEVADFDRSRCSYFVQEAVLPLLGPISGAGITYAALPHKQLAPFITDWMSPYPPSTAIASDHEFDWMWLTDALAGTLPANIAPQPRSLGEWAAEPDFELSRQSFFVREKLPQHHALWDARALRHAFFLVKALMSRTARF